MHSESRPTLPDFIGRETHRLEMISGAAYEALPQNVKVFPPGASSKRVLANEKSTRIA